MNKIIGFFYKETNSLNQAAFLLGLFAFLSQILAFLRDRLLAHIFGASTELDIYYAAFRVPDFLFVTVASVVSLSVLIPFIIEKEAAGKEELKKFMGNVFSFFLVLMIFVAALAFWFMPYLSGLLFKGLPPESLEEVIFLSRVLLLSPLFLGLSNLFGSITQAYNRFALYALAPLLYNVGIIAGIILLGERLGVIGIVIGVVTGAFLHFLVQVPFVWKEGLLPNIGQGIDFLVIKRVAAISLPRTLTLSMSSIILIFLVSLASLMASGSISVISFSINLQSVPLSLIGISYSLAAFPTLTRKFQEKNIPAFIEQMAFTTRFIIFWSLPLTALLIVLRAQVVRTLLGTGLFDWDATRLTAAALALFVLSSMFQSLMTLFMRGFYSAGFTKKPFCINLVSTIILILSTFGLLHFFNESESFRMFILNLLNVKDIAGTSVLMLPLGYSIGTIVNCLILWLAFELEFKGFTSYVSRSFFENLGASLVMGVVAYVFLNIFDSVFDLETLHGIFLQGFLSGLIAILAGVTVLKLCQSRELSQVWVVLKGKFWKTRVIATDPEIV